MDVQNRFIDQLQRVNQGSNKGKDESSLICGICDEVLINNSYSHECLEEFDKIVIIGKQLYPALYFQPEKNFTTLLFTYDFRKLNASQKYLIFDDQGVPLFCLKRHPVYGWEMESNYASSPSSSKDACKDSINVPLINLDEEIAMPLLKKPHIENVGMYYGTEPPHIKSSGNFNHDTALMANKKRRLEESQQVENELYVQNQEEPSDVVFTIFVESMLANFKSESSKIRVKRALMDTLMREYNEIMDETNGLNLSLNCFK